MNSWPLARFVAICVLVIGSIYGFSQRSNAVPLNVHFKAEIVEIHGAVPPQLPFELEVGNTILASYSFPVEGLIADEAMIPGQVSLEVDDTVLYSDNVQLSPHAAVLGLPVPFPNSTVLADCFSETDVLGCQMGVIPNSAEIIWRVSLTLVGEDQTVTVGSDLLDSGTWNALQEYRVLTMELLDGTAGASSEPVAVVEASVGIVSLVPELSTCSLGIVAVMLTLSIRFRRFRIELLALQSNQQMVPRLGRASNDSSLAQSQLLPI